MANMANYFIYFPFKVALTIYFKQQLWHPPPKDQADMTILNLPAVNIGG
jgi:hypothetical protein